MGHWHYYYNAEEPRWLSGPDHKKFDSCTGEKENKVAELPTVGNSTVYGWTATTPGIYTGDGVLIQDKTTGGNKVSAITISVADLFEVYPELTEAYYSAGYAEDDEKRDLEQQFARNVLRAAEYNRGKAAVKALKKLNNKEDK